MLKDKAQIFVRIKCSDALKMRLLETKDGAQKEGGEQEDGNMAWKTTKAW